MLAQRPQASDRDLLAAFVVICLAIIALAAVLAVAFRVFRLVAGV